jgi:uncharacterized Zn-binding protein involved in type VI secretion
MKPAARITDPHACPVHGPGVVGPVTMPNIMFGMIPAARVTDICVCWGGPNPVAMGSVTVMIGMIPVARIADPTSHGGAIAMGLPSLLVGG